MPPVDLVLVSHDHYDHLDYPTIRELAKRDVPFVTSLGVGAQLVMPRLGEPVEPAHTEAVEPWWRVVDKTAKEPEPDTPVATTLPKAMPWPID